MSIPRRDELPEDFYEMRDVQVSLPRLTPDSPLTCPVPMKSVLEYLSYEAPGGEHSGGDRIIEFELEFVRSALVEQTKYWIWKFLDEDSLESYVTVAVDPQGQEIIGYDESFGLTPEQFIVADYYEMA